jgi:murein hydrolase activator
VTRAALVALAVAASLGAAHGDESAAHGDPAARGEAAAHGEATRTRPAAAIEADMRAAEADVRDLERRAHALDQQQHERRDRLKQRLRALYKLSSGGLLRILAGAESAADLRTRHAALERILSRDLDELGAVRDESAALDADMARRAGKLARAVELGNLLRQYSDSAPVGFEALQGGLVRPVPGPVTTGGAFGAFHDPETTLARTRRGIELRSHAGETVRAAAGGEVRWVGDVPGHGRGIAIDHGDGWLSLTAHLARTRLAPGDLVADGAPLGESALATVYFELTQEGTPIDPSSWLAR